MALLLSNRVVAINSLAYVATACVIFVAKILERLERMKAQKDIDISASIFDLYPVSNVHNAKNAISTRTKRRTFSLKRLEKKPKGCGEKEKV